MQASALHFPKIPSIIDIPTMTSRPSLADLQEFNRRSRVAAPGDEAGNRARHGVRVADRMTKRREQRRLTPAPDNDPRLSPLMSRPKSPIYCSALQNGSRAIRDCDHIRLGGRGLQCPPPPPKDLVMSGAWSSDHQANPLRSQGLSYGGELGSTWVNKGRLDAG